MKTQRPVIVETQTHLPTWMRVHRGLTWLDMPCADSETKKLNFCLFVRGLYDPDLEPVSDEDSGLDEEGLRKAKRDSRGRVLQKAGRVKYGSINRLSPAGGAAVAERVSANRASMPARAKRQAGLLLRYAEAKAGWRNGFVRALYVLDPTAHSAITRALGVGRGCQGPLRGVSLDRIERAFEKLKEEGWKV